MPRYGSIMVLVEDHEPTRRVLTRLLASQGWEVKVAATVAEGVALLDTDPDGLLLDLMLPDGDGEEILRRARLDGRKARVAIATATGDPERLEAVLRLGADAVLRKPLNFDDVQRVFDCAY